MIINSVNSAYSQIASGNRINSASNDPAALAISEKLNSQIKGKQQAIKNIETSQDLLKTAGGSLQNIQSDLGRIRELSIQSSNGIYTKDDKKAIQMEINSLLNNIKDSVKNTEFNKIKLLDGSFYDKTLGVGANGQGSIMSIENVSLQSLGIENFNIENNFNIDDIDQAINKISKSLSKIGARTNGLNSNLNNTRVSEFNQTNAKSTLADLDIAKAIIDLNKQKSLDQYKLILQKKQSETAKQKLGFLI